MMRIPISVRLTLAGLVLAALSSLLPDVPAAGPLFGCAAWACLIAAAAAVLRARRGTVPPPAAAAWAVWSDAADLTRPGPMLLGVWPASGVPLYLNEEQASAHILLLGPSRTGKTAGIIAPNVLLRDPSRESIVVLDVKTGPRSLWNVTAGRYAGRAHLFCPLFERSIRYNPLDRITTVGDAQRAAALLVHNTTPRDLSGDAQVYASAAADLAALLFLHVQHDRAAGGHTVGAVYRILLRGAGGVRAALSGSPISAVRERAGVFAARERRVRDAAVTGLLQRLAAWADPAVDDGTAGHWDLGLLGQTPAALYVLLPEPEAARLQPLVAWLVADLLDTLIAQADRGERRCPVRVYLDEFRRFGYLAGLSDRLPTLRERGVSVLLGAQVLSQIEEVYGAREARTLVANTETKLVFRAGDLDTARAVSAWLGQTTVPVISRTLGPGGARATIHPHVRPLALPDDIVRIPDGMVLALAGARPALALRQARYFDSSVGALLPPAAPPPFPLHARADRAAVPVVAARAAGTGSSAISPCRAGVAPRFPHAQGLGRRPAPRPYGGVTVPPPSQAIDAGQ
jgi:type IV secretion system protein VirD4